MKESKIKQYKKGLLQLLKKKAFKRGRIVLSSGKVSNYYLDGRLITLCSQGAYLLASAILELIKDKKITAIGLAVRDHITMHGFAFNVNTNLDHFKFIIPCGIKDKGVTSLQAELKEETPLDLSLIKEQVSSYFKKVFF